jgi:hypothetical protein
MHDDHIDETFDAIVAGFADETDDEPGMFQVVDGVIHLDLPDEAVVWLASLLTGYRLVVDHGALPDSLAAPPVYSDPELAAAHGDAEVAAEDLRTTRLGSVDAVLGSLEAGWFDPSTVPHWLRALNAVKLLLTKDFDTAEKLEAFYASGSPASVAALTCWALQDSLLEALDGSTP